MRTYLFFLFCFFYATTSNSQDQQDSSLNSSSISFYYKGTKIPKQLISIRGSTLDSLYEINYFKNGKIRSEGNTYKSQRIGLWNFYDTTGTLIESYQYDQQFTVFLNEQSNALIDSLQVKNIDLNFLKSVDAPPHFVGGILELFAFFNSTIRYPIAAKLNNIEGCVILRCEIDALGNPLNPKVVRSLGFGCDEEAIRVFQLMPRWVPATKYGSPTKSIFYIPVNFKINE